MLVSVCGSAFSPITVMTTMADLVSKCIAALADSIKTLLLLVCWAMFQSVGTAFNAV